MSAATTATAAGFALSGLSFAYGAHAVFEGFSLALARGRFHAVLGPNGCGKTTLLGLLAGYLSPSDGSVRLGGDSLAGLRGPERARRIAYVPQTPAFAFPFTVREVVAMGRHPHRSRFAAPSSRDWEAVDAALAALDLGALSDQPVTELSGGERQRVLLARALAQETPVLLLDEPTSNLDIRHALEVLRLVRDRVDATGLTVVAVMHDLNLAAMFAETCVFLRAGRLAADGPLREVFTAATLRAVFDVESAVEWDPDAGCPHVRIVRERGREDPA